MKRQTATSYPRTRQALHWLGALLILAMFPMGFLMARTDSDTLRSALYGAHAVGGLLILVIAALRIVLAVRRPVTPPPGLAGWNEKMFKGVHWLALVVPLLLAMSGLGALATNDLVPAALQPGTVIPATLTDPRAQTGHRLLVWTYLAVLAVHVGGVMRYQLTKGNVLKRMGVGRPA